MKRLILFAFGFGLVGFGSVALLSDAAIYRGSNPRTNLITPYTTYQTDRGTVRCAPATIAHDGTRICGSNTYNFRPFTGGIPYDGSYNRNRSGRNNSSYRGYVYRGSFYSRKPGYTAYELMSSEEKEAYIKNQDTRYNGTRPVVRKTQSIPTRPVYTQNLPSVSRTYTTPRVNNKKVYFTYYHNPNTIRTTPKTYTRDYKFYSSSN